MSRNTDSILVEEQFVEQERQDLEYIEEITIITRGVDFSVRELKIMVEEKELIVPEFQREIVWDGKRKSRFIESILLGYPIPGMFFTDLEKGQMMIIDGQQRINTLVEFLNNELKISNTDDINPNWRSKFYRDLEDESKAKLRSSNIRASVFKMLSDNEEEKNIALYSLFERINTGSIQLNSQEIRRSIYFGEYVKVLNSFVEKPSWIMAYKSADYIDAQSIQKDKRLKDQEIISRVLTLESILERNIESDISYKKEINKFMSSIRKIKKEDAEELLRRIERKLIWLKEKTPIELGYLFRRPKEVYDEIPSLEELENELKSKRFNIPLFEAVILNLDTNKLDKTSFDENKYRSLFIDEQFLESISKQTNKKENILYRMEKLQEVLPIDEE